jgi:hypothetical protein
MEGEAPYWCDFCGTSHLNPVVVDECKRVQETGDVWELGD